MRIRKNLVFLWALGLAAAVCAVASADGRDVALASDGTLYQVRTGAYRTLFPQGRDTAPGNSVVALDVTPPGGAAQRILVPGTAGQEAESLASVVFAEDSQSIFLLWETSLNVHPILQLASFDGKSWSSPIQVTGNPFAVKASPQFTITRDSYDDVDGNGEAVTHHRTVLHMIWQEQDATDQFDTFYTPIVITDGEYIGWNPIYRLDDFLPVRTAAVTGGQAALIGSPVLQGGPDARTVVVAYASPTASRLVTIEVDSLPQQLSQLAEKARGHIVDLGKAGNYPSNLGDLAEKARGHIVDLGVAFHPDVIHSIADQVKAQILSDGALGLDLLALAEKARGHIVDLGAQLCGWGLRSSNGSDLAKILEIGDTPNPVPTAGGAATNSHLFQFRVAANLPLPSVGPGAVRLFSSETGENLIVSWAQPDRLFYRNSRADGTWGETKQLVFSSNLDLAKAYQILDQRLRGH